MLEASRGRTDELGGVEPQLHQLVGRIRWRLGREQLLVFALRGGIGAALLLVGLGLSAWLLDTPLAGWSLALASLAPLDELPRPLACAWVPVGDELPCMPCWLAAWL